MIELLSNFSYLGSILTIRSEPRKNKSWVILILKDSSFKKDVKNKVKIINKNIIFFFKFLIKKRKIKKFKNINFINANLSPVIIIVKKIIVKKKKKLEILKLE